MSQPDDLPKRPNPGINVANVLDRLRFETNRAQANAIIDRAIEQVRRDYLVLNKLANTLTTIVKDLESADPIQSMDVVGTENFHAATDALKGVLRRMKYLVRRKSFDGIWESRFGRGQRFGPWKTVAKYLTEVEAMAFLDKQRAGLDRWEIKCGKEIIARKD